jgi:hypothetical protein
MVTIPEGAETLMARPDSLPGRLWPAPRGAALLASAAILLVLIITVVVGRETIGWPTEGMTQWIVPAILIVSVIPLALTLVDLVAERGGKLGSRWLSVEFAAVVQPLPALEIPTNIVPGTQITDRDRDALLQMLQSAYAHEVVEIDLEDGEAWWLSRLLILCAGAVHRSRPSALVFIATDATVPRVFQGWAPPGELLEGLLRRNAELRAAFHRARRAVDQLNVVGQQVATPAPGTGNETPTPRIPGWDFNNPPSWLTNEAKDNYYLVFSSNSILGPMALEQMIAKLLVGTEPPPNGGVSMAQLEELFGSILRTRKIERSDPIEMRLERLLTTPDKYVALTDAGQFVGLQRTEQAGRAVLLSLIPPTADRER